MDAAKRRPRRWWRRLMMAVAAALLLMAAAWLAATVAMRSDWPRRIVLDLARSETGLWIDCRELRTGWSGRTVLRDVEVWAPLERSPMVRVERLELEHTGPLRIALSLGAFELRKIGLHSLQVDARQDADGSWNLERAARMLTDGATGGGGKITLPAIDVPDGVVRIHSADAATVEAPLRLRGEPDRLVAWGFEAQIADWVRATGEVSPGGAWPHRVEASISPSPVGDAILRMAGVELDGVTGSVSWRGELAQDSVTGVLETAGLGTSAGEIAGRIGLRARAGQADVEIARLDLRTRDASGSPGEIAGTIRGGLIRVRGGEVELIGARASAAGHAAEINGAYDLTRRNGTIETSWAALGGAAASHSGSLRGRFHAGGLSGDTGAFDFQSRGRAGDSFWDAAGTIDATFVREDKLARIGINLEHLTAGDEKREIDLGGIRLGLAIDAEAARLDRLAVVNGKVERAVADYRFDDGTWTAEVEIGSWRPRARGIAEADRNLRLVVDAHGSGASAEIGAFRLEGEGFGLLGRGSLDADGGLDGLVEAHADGAKIPGVRDLSGKLSAKARVRGTTSPLDLAVRGEVSADEAEAGGIRIGMLAAPFGGRVTEEAANVDIGPFALAGGSVKAAADVDLTDLGATGRIVASDVLVTEALKAAGIEFPASGIAGLRMEFAAPGLDHRRLTGSGAWTVRELVVHGEGPGEGGGDIALEGSNLSLNDIRIVRGDGLLSGSARIPLERALGATGELSLERWPLTWDEGELTGLVEGRATMRVNEESRRPEGEIRLRTESRVRGQPVGAASLSGTLAGDILTLDRVEGELMGGTISGSASVPLDRLREGHGRLDISGVDLALLRHVWPELEPLKGVAHAEVRFAKTEGERPPEPTRVEARIRTTDASWGPVEIGNAQATGHIGPRRIVFDVTEAEIAGGRLRAWGSTSLHKEQRYVFTNVHAEKLVIDQLVRLGDPASQPTPGRLALAGAGGGYLQQPHRLFGGADLELIESDLAHLPVISTLYSALRPRSGGDTPQGHGVATVRLEDSSLYVPRVYYFNRGVDVVANLRVADIWQGKQSPIHGIAAGHVRPLKDLGLPFGTNLDRLFTAVQTGAAAVLIEGSAGEIRTRVVPFMEVHDSLRRLVTGSAGR